jgi:hypothetical protein
MQGTTGKEERTVMADAKSQDAKPQDARSQNTKSQNAKSQESRTPAIAGLVIAAVLLVVGLWLARELTAVSKMQDCLMSGRTNCNVIQAQ